MTRKNPKRERLGLGCWWRQGGLKPRSAAEGVSLCCINVVLFALKTCHSLRFGQMPVRPKGVSKKKRTFGPPTFRHFTEARGPFVDPLPAKSADETGVGTLH